MEQGKEMKNDNKLELIFMIIAITVAILSASIMFIITR